MTETTFHYAANSDLKGSMNNVVGARRALPAMFAEHSQAIEPSGYHFATSLRLTPACLRVVERPRIIRNLVCARADVLVVYDVCLLSTAPEADEAGQRDHSPTFAPADFASAWHRDWLGSRPYSRVRYRWITSTHRIF